MATKKDKEVLQSILDPTAAVGEAVCSGEDDDQGVDLVPSDDEDEVDDDDVEKSRQLEADGVRAAEDGHFALAVDLFTEAVQAAPRRASPYNNRAQAIRLKGMNAADEKSRTEDEQAAMDDLDRAVELCAGRRCRTARQAHCQRGLMHRLRGNTDQAVADLTSAAHLGSLFARRQLVALNPYAAMCNRMLAQVIGKLQNPMQQQQCE